MPGATTGHCWRPSTTCRFTSSPPCPWPSTDGRTSPPARPTRRPSCATSTRAHDSWCSRSTTAVSRPDRALRSRRWRAARRPSSRERAAGGVKRTCETARTACWSRRVGSMRSATRSGACGTTPITARRWAPARARPSSSTSPSLAWRASSTGWSRPTCDALADQAGAPSLGPAPPGRGRRPSATRLGRHQHATDLVAVGRRQPVARPDGALPVDARLRGALRPRGAPGRHRHRRPARGRPDRVRSRRDRLIPAAVPRRRLHPPRQRVRRAEGHQHRGSPPRRGEPGRRFHRVRLRLAPRGSREPLVRPEPAAWRRRQRADPAIFHPVGADAWAPGKVLRLVTHHWSDNWNKGFDVYQEVDRFIAEGRLPDTELWVIGRWPKEIRWRTTRTYGPTAGEELGALLRRCHVYLTASRFDPGPMHPIEGVQCGL